MTVTGEPRLRHRIPPQSGWATTLAAGELLRVVDPEGGQVADLFAVPADAREDGLSPGRTIDYGGSIRVTTGTTLWSMASRRLLTVVADDVGVHDLLLAPCSQAMFEILHGHRGAHPSCHANLVSALAEHGVRVETVTGSLNVFMNVEVARDGRVRVLPPPSRAGDALTMRAETDLVVGLTACSAEETNGGTFRPIDVEVHRG